MTIIEMTLGKMTLGRMRLIRITHSKMTFIRGDIANDTQHKRVMVHLLLTQVFVQQSVIIPNVILLNAVAPI
jgi:hypothetical protein